MGLRLRLKRSYSLRGVHGQSRAILTALRRYGLIVADNGSPWFISGTRRRALGRRRSRADQARPRLGVRGGQAVTATSGIVTLAEP